MDMIERVNLSLSKKISPTQTLSTGFIYVDRIEGGRLRLSKISPTQTLSTGFIYVDRIEGGRLRLSKISPTQSLSTRDELKAFGALWWRGWS